MDRQDRARPHRKAYLGFPMGISGQELTGRALTQAQKFGANMMIARTAVRLRCDRRNHIRSSSTRSNATADALHRAGRRRPHTNATPFPSYRSSREQRRSLAHGATAMEAQLCVGADVVVVGGGNSAGQAAVYLSGKGAQGLHAGALGQAGRHNVALPDLAHRRKCGD